MSKRRFARTLALSGLTLFALIAGNNTALLAQVPVYQTPQPVQVPESAQVPQPVQPVAMTPPELDSLVAPVALYPDPLLSQILVACTYPLEIVQASQWLQQNPGLTGPALENAARQQNWDPSVQALLVFPEVLRLLSGNVQWTTNLGNAFLTQQPEVMDAVQRMRSQAQNAGTLRSTPEIVVNTQPGPGPAPVIAIEPANPQVMYVPVYDPAFIWGPSLYPYPVLWYPPAFVRGRFISFGPRVVISAWFGGWGGWAGWGWGPNWIGRTIVVNNNFFYRYGFRRGAVTVAGGPAVWVHDSAHRWGVPYPYRQGAVNYAAASRPAFVNRPMAVSAAPPNVARTAPLNGGRMSYAPQRSYASSYTARSYAPPTRSYAPSASYTSPRIVAPASTPRSSYVPQARAFQNYRAASPGRTTSSNRGESRGSGHGSSRHR